MAGAGLYGVLVGLVFVGFAGVAPQPTGSVLFWTVLAVQLAYGAAICWRRTGLPFATAAMTLGSAVSVWLALLATTGRVFPDLTVGEWFVAAIGIGVPPVLLLIESRVNRSRWQEWAHYMEHKSAWDIATGRHIPRLRHRA